MSTLRPVFALLFGLLLIFCGGCSSGGGTGNTEANNGGGEGTKVVSADSKKTAKTAPANVWLDNYNPKPCAVTLDGESKGTLEPFACQFLEMAAGTHTFVLTSEGQPAETVKADLPSGKTTLVRPAAAGDYLILTRTYTAAGPSTDRSDIRQVPAPKTGVFTADYGPLDAFPDALAADAASVADPKSEDATAATRTMIARSLPEDPGLAELEHFFVGDYRFYGIAQTRSHRDVLLDQLKQLEPRVKDPAVGDLLIRIADTLAVCPAGKDDIIAISDAILRLLPPDLKNVPDEKLMAWLGIDPQTGKARALPDGQRVNPSIASAAVSLLLQRGKQQQLLDGFPTLPGDAARAVVASLAKPPAPEELRRRVVILGFGRREEAILKEACSAIADKDFVPTEEMVEALSATIEQLDPNKDEDRATIKYCSSCLVDAFFRHPAVVARPKTRRFLVRYADPQLEPTLENARNALIDGRCAGDLVPIYTHFSRDPRIDMVGHLVSACRKREAVGPDVIELLRVSLTDEDTEVRLTAAKALPQLAVYLTQENLPAIQDLLVRALSDPSLEIHQAAAQALEVNGFVPTEQIANQLVAAWRQLDANDPQGKANRDQLAKALKTSFEKNPGVEADKSWRERALAALAQ